MAFRVQGIKNFAGDRAYPDAADIIARAEAAAKEFGEGNMFSGGKIEHVLGSEERVTDFMAAREGNLDRYT